MQKPRVFAGSSSEAITLARAIQYQLRDDASVTIWDEDPAFLGTDTLNWLVHGLARYDFAVMVFAPDDTSTSRGQTGGAVRDNVLFELGLFMAKLGPERTYVVYDTDPATQVKIPSDLKAIGFATFSGKEAAAQSSSGSDRYDFGRALTAVGSACSLIRDRIKRLGTLAGIQEVRVAVDQVEKRQALQQNEIKAIQIAIAGLLTKHERGLLEGLTRDEFPIRYEPDLKGYLHRLDGLDFIQPHPGLGLIDIENQHRADEYLPVPPHERPPFNLKDYVYITGEGTNYLNIFRQNRAAGQ